jgi:hypothetical protein
MKHLFLLIAACSATVAQAQDVIVKRDGSTILTKVLEVNQTDIKYKKFSNQQGPTYTINKSEVMAINYESGDKDTFEDAPQPVKQEADGKPQIIEAQPAADNAEIISRYNQTYEHGEAIKDKDKQAKAGLCFLGVSEKSVLSTEDIVVEFRQEPYNIWYGVRYDLLNRFFVQLYNKTDHIVYVDLGATFRVMADGTSYTYFDNSRTTISNGTGSGAGVNLGAVAGAVGIGGALGTLANGISVGGGKSTTVSKVYEKQRIVAIPPHGRYPIEKYEEVFIKSSKSEVVSEGELLRWDFSKEHAPAISHGGILVYEEAQSPYRADYTITYSNTPNFETAYILKSSVYMRELIGGGYDYVEPRKPEKLYEIIKERIPGYNSYSIVGSFEVIKK